MAVATKWHIQGSYFESCNCDPICPCRRIDGVAGGRSTHGICTGVLSWLIEEGSAGETDLAGLAAALAVRYDDDEPGSPWSWILYVDERATDKQFAALEAIFTGRARRRRTRATSRGPGRRASSSRVRRVAIDVDHTPRRQWLRVRDHVTVRIRDRFAGEATVSCVIPGHDRDGEELVAEELRVDDDGLSFEFSGVCGYGSTFSYSG